MASASPAMGGLRRRCWLGALAGDVGPGVVAKSLLGIDIATSKREVTPPLSLLCRRMFAFSMGVTQFGKKPCSVKQNAVQKLLTRTEPQPLTANKACIETAGNGHIGGALHQRAPVREERDRIPTSLETQQKPVEVNLSVRFQAALHLGKVNRAMMFMDLHRIPAAQRDLGTVFSPQISKVTLLADWALRPGSGGADFGLVIGPQIAAQEGSAHLVLCAHQKLQGLGHLDRGGEIDR